MEGTFAALKRVANGIGFIKRNLRWRGKGPGCASLSRRVADVAGAAEIFAGDVLEYIIHGFGAGVRVQVA